MELQRIGVKLFVENPEEVRLLDLIPVFHSWIQRQAIPEHLFIDVHNYSHVFRGPGILLVGHEGNFSMDQEEERLGLLYVRKAPLSGSPVERLKQIFKTALQGARLLEAEEKLQPPPRFGTGEWFILANDRLHAPNTAETFESFQPELEKFLGGLLNGSGYGLTQRSEAKERFGVTVRLKDPVPLEALLERLS